MTDMCNGQGFQSSNFESPSNHPALQALSKFHKRKGSVQVRWLELHLDTKSHPSLSRLAGCYFMSICCQREGKPSFCCITCSFVSGAIILNVSKFDFCSSELICTEKKSLIFKRHRGSCFCRENKSLEKRRLESSEFQYLDSQWV